MNESHHALEKHHGTYVSSDSIMDHTFPKDIASNDSSRVFEVFCHGTGKLPHSRG
jgi:hypothetical protein